MFYSLQTRTIPTHSRTFRCNIIIIIAAAGTPLRRLAGEEKVGAVTAIRVRAHHGEVNSASNQFSARTMLTRSRTLESSVVIVQLRVHRTTFGGGGEGMSRRRRREDDTGIG